ncbi:low affinity immunoglobulin gamma Fc region receptor II-a-like isoform X2 [Thunnus albacares]|uniref:low affinity immunoglobulin gamma Fc region receptor II-a-like isoform X2 n=1 Tax=Thunnus albacares TaxID=8236 RepID=UPI001CF71161|nr:low affinity immunoglobulin gamma Fc region receptor II-a-like isoform X2 [Thunnus albacares]
MEVTALCFRLLMLEIIQQVQESDAAFLRITPDRLQHFELDSVSLDCVGFDDSTQLRGIRNNEEFTPVCDINKRTPTESFCTIDVAYTVESGEYWCETDGGERSNSVNITVTAGSVILESPVLPVMGGDNVTLRCRNKTNSTNLRADFYKDGVLMKSTAAAEMTINNVSMSDEGLYKCTSDVGTSPESWLAVGAKSVSVTSQTPHEGNHTVLHHSSIPTHLHLWIAVIIVTLSLVLLVVGFLCIWRRKGTAVFCFSSKTSSGSSEHNQIASDTAGAADSLSRDTNHRRKPQTQKDEDESSRQPVYSALKLDKTPQALQTGLYVCKIFKIPKFIYFSTTTDISTLCLHLIRPICDYKGPHIHFLCGSFDSKVTLTVSYDSNDHLQLIQNIFSIVKDILKPRTYCTK